MGRALTAVALAFALTALAAGLFGRLSHPLLWQDEGETAMFGARILEYGYPKVHGERNVLYEFGADFAIGRKESIDAYIGKTWGDFYFAAPAVWWARQVDDPWQQTGRLRLPFVMAGAAGLAALWWGLVAVVPRSQRLGLAVAYCAMLAPSVSLLLHLRQARYYPLLVGLLCMGLALHVRHREGALGQRAFVVAQTAVSVALFHVFTVGWFAATALLGLDALHAGWRGAPEGRAQRILRATFPYVLGGVFVAPALVFFETFAIAAGFADDVGTSVAGYVANVGQLLGHFARHEWLVPVVLARLAVVLSGGDAPAPAARAWATRGLLFCLGYAALGCINPLVYERYFVVLGPVLVAVFLLDVSTLVERAAPARRALWAGAAVAVGLLALVPRLDTLTGLATQLREPVRGPVDFVVEHLRARYPDPAALIIATNYEAHPLMFYLGSHVIVGLSHNNIVAERALTPDVVIPRGRWPRGIPELRRFLRKGQYRVERLPVLDVHYNQIPAVTPSAATPDPHRFTTPVSAPDGAGRLQVHHRASG